MNGADLGAGGDHERTRREVAIETFYTVRGAQTRPIGLTNSLSCELTGACPWLYPVLERDYLDSQFEGE